MNYKYKQCISYWIAVSAMILIFLPNARAGDAIADAAAKITGAEVVQTGKMVTGLNIKSCKDLTEADYQKIRQLETMKSLSFGMGLDDAGLKILAGMPALESFTTNGLNATDEGLRALATCKALRTLTFFHPGKSFQGTGLAAFADLPNLEGFSVGGTLDFNDASMTMVGKFAHLKNFRTWHTGVTTEGVKALGACKELKSLMIGQRLSMKPPVTLDDETVAVIAGFASLETLTLAEARLSLPALSKLKQLPNLKSLTLDNIDIPESDLAALKQQLPNVNIKWTAPNESGLKRIEALFGAKK